MLLSDVKLKEKIGKTLKFLRHDSCGAARVFSFARDKLQHFAEFLQVKNLVSERTYSSSTNLELDRRPLTPSFSRDCADDNVLSRLDLA